MFNQNEDHIIDLTVNPIFTGQAPPSYKDTKQFKENQFHLKLAFLNATRSKDPATKVGSVIVSSCGRMISTGYNGFPKGVQESVDLWEKPEKYRRVIHAEVNAILNCPFEVRGSVLYTTLFPCSQCLGFIIQSGIQTIVFYGKLWEKEPNKDLREEWSQYLHIVTHPDNEEMNKYIEAINV